MVREVVSDMIVSGEAIPEPIEAEIFGTLAGINENQFTLQT
jgi:hypothetical protein